MIQKLARIVFRENGDINKPDLIIGSCFKNQNIFKGNEVWEIQDIIGSLTLVKIGPSVINSGVSTFTWGRSVNDLLHLGKYLYLTKQEYDDIIKGEK